MLLTGQKIIDCLVQNSKENPEQVVVKNNVGKVEYIGTKSIKTSQGQISGHCASVGNPHFVVLEKKDISWLQSVSWLRPRVSHWKPELPMELSDF